MSSSVTRNTRDLDNLKDRFDNYYVLKDYFDDGELFNKVIKIYLERFFFPIKGIFTNSLYKKTYLKGLYDILDDIENVYDNEYISIVYNLCAYFVLNKQIDTLEEFLLNYSTVKNIFIEKDKIYWDLKYFRNSKYNIPDKLFEIKNIHHYFININDMEVDSDYIYLNNISIPHNLKIDEAKIIFEGMTRKYGSKDKNNYQFDLEIIGINKFNAKVPIKKIDNINSYDVFLEFNYNGKKEDFRVNKKNFTKEIDESDINKNMNTLVLFTKCNNLSFLNVDIKEIFEINYMEDGLKIIPKKVGDANYKISINHKWVSERVYFIKSVDNEIWWQFSGRLAVLIFSLQKFSGQQQSFFQTFQSLAGFLQLTVIKIQRTAVMYRQQVEPYYLARILSQYIPDYEKITQRFRHFFIIDGNEAIMHPVSGKRFTRSRFRLGDFILVMRENQILAAAMDINGSPQMFHRHDGALGTFPSFIIISAV